MIQRLLPRTWNLRTKFVLPISAMVQNPCDSMKIWPSSFSLLPTFLP